MSWTEFHPLIQEAILTTFAVGALVMLVLAIRKPFAQRFGAKKATSYDLGRSCKLANTPMCMFLGTVLS